MTKRELVRKLEEIVTAIDRIDASLVTASEELVELRKDMEGLPQTVEEIEEE